MIVSALLRPYCDESSNHPQETTHMLKERPTCEAQLTTKRSSAGIASSSLRGKSNTSGTPCRLQALKCQILSIHRLPQTLKSLPLCKPSTQHYEMPRERIAQNAHVHKDAEV